MKWIGERISFIDDKIKTTLVIYPENVTWVKGVMGAWVGMWLAIGYTVIWSFFKLNLTDQENIIIVIFLIFWSYYAVKVLRSFLWLLWGKELIMIDELALSYKKSIRGYGKLTPYYIENISNLRVFNPKENSIQTVWEKSPWVKGGERIEFDYMGKVVRFGRKLKEKDTVLLYKLISKRLLERLRKLG